MWSPLRASSDHRFIVGALRTQRPCQLSRHSPSELVALLSWRAACLVSYCAQLSHPPAHRHAETCHQPERAPSDFPHFALRGAARLSFTARIEGAHSDCAASASKKDGLAAPLSSLFEEPPNPRLNLVQPLAQVGLKNIGLGLHHHALGLELVLEQHQIGE